MIKLEQVQVDSIISAINSRAKITDTYNKLEVDNKLTNQSVLSNGHFCIFDGVAHANVGQSVPILTNSNGYQRLNGTIYITANESMNGQAIYHFGLSQYGLVTNQIFNEGSITLNLTANGTSNTLNIKNDFTYPADYQITIVMHNMALTSTGISSLYLTRIL